MREPDPRRSPLRWTTALVALALGVSPGCDTPTEDDATAWREAMPDADALLYVFPETDEVEVLGDALGLATGALVGDESEIWAAGHDATRTVNLALRGFLNPIDRLVAHVDPVTTAKGRRVWRGAPPGSLDEDLLVVERADDGHFEYTLWSRERLRPRADWRFRLYGSTTPSTERRRGRGALWVDLEGDRLPATRGKVLALWEVTAERREVAVTFHAASPDEAATPAGTKSFLFRRTSAGGLLAYGPELVDVHDDPERDAIEEVRVLGRWTPDGRARGDAAITGGDVDEAGYALVLKTECWRSPSHAVTYEATHARKRTASGVGPLLLGEEDGDRASCPLGDPEVPVLPAIGAEPTPPPLPPEALEEAP